jgi:predicted enzyme related to lactoylglutathione lyase
MPEFSSYPPGTPSWVDLSTPDVDASVRFYTAVFGWEAVEAGPPEETGGYRMFTKNGKQVAGVGPTQQEGQPPAWTVYMATEDANETADKASADGGQVFVPPFDVLDAGRMTIIADPVGAIFGVWQPGRHKGAELATEPGAFTWNELLTRDIEKPKPFYKAVFGWEAETREMGPMTYTEFKLGGKSIAGMMQMGDRFPPEVPPHWNIYFGATDVDATVAKAQELGGQSMFPPMDSPAGRIGAVVDPQGARFSLIGMST